MKRKFLSFLLLAGWLSGCGEERPVAFRFVDHFKPEMVKESKRVTQRDIPRTEWKFDGTIAAPKGKFAATYGWQAGHGVAGLAVRENRLVGRSTLDFPVIHVERTSGLDNPDLVHAVEVRLKVSAGANLALENQRSEKPDIGKSVQQTGGITWQTTTPIIAGENFRTYTMRPPVPIKSSAVRHLLLRPTDAAGARFEIESVRLIFRKEHLASIPAGVGWHGLGDIYRETLVARAPEKIEMDVHLPDRPWLDLAVGTIEDGPIIFRVQVSSANSSGKLVFSREITTPNRWEAARIDLSEFAGREVTVSLSLDAHMGEGIGFWGAPVVRDDGAEPQRISSAGNKTPQGVILIMADTLRRDHLDAYGYHRPTAMTLTTLADQGALFRDCLSQATWTKVSTPSLLTSLYPSTHGVSKMSDRLPESATTLAEVFREAGFATLSVSSVPFSGQMTNLHQGFEQLHERSSIAEGGSKTAREYVDRLLPWLETHREVPFFVFLHVFDPHDPFEPRKPFNTLWASAERGEEHKKQMEELKKFIKMPFMKNRGMPDEEELKKSGLDREKFLSHLGDWYDGSISGLGAEIDRILLQLWTLGLGEKTLIVFTSDHGEEFLEHGLMFHGQSVYGELTNIPLIMHGEGIVPEGVVVNETVQSIDIMPTILELSGLPVPEGVQGRSLVPFFKVSPSPKAASLALLQEESEESIAAQLKVAQSKAKWAVDWDRPAMSERAYITDSPELMRGVNVESIAFVKDGWKLIRNRKEGKGERTYELFDHRKDPLNMKDLAAEKPGLVIQLAADLEAFHQKALDAKLPPDSAGQKGMSKEDLERLRSLGYIQ